MNRRSLTENVMIVSFPMLSAYANFFNFSEILLLPLLFFGGFLMIYPSLPSTGPIRRFIMFRFNCFRFLRSKNKILIEEGLIRCEFKLVNFERFEQTKDSIGTPRILGYKGDDFIILNKEYKKNLQFLKKNKIQTNIFFVNDEIIDNVTTHQIKKMKYLMAVVI